MSHVLLKMLIGALVLSQAFFCPRVVAKNVSQKDVDMAETQAKLKFCESKASLVASMAVERDKGTPLSDLYKRLPDNKYFPRAQNFEVAKFVYANPDKSPSDFKNALLSDCYKKVQDPNG